MDIEELETLTEKQAETIRQLKIINQRMLDQNRVLTRRLKQDTVPLKAIESACFNFFKMMKKDDRPSRPKTRKRSILQSTTAQAATVTHWMPVEELEN